MSYVSFWLRLPAMQWRSCLLVSSYVSITTQLHLQTQKRIKQNKKVFNNCVPACDGKFSFFTSALSASLKRFITKPVCTSIKQTVLPPQVARIVPVSPETHKVTVKVKLRVEVVQSMSVAQNLSFQANQHTTKWVNWLKSECWGW